MASYSDDFNRANGDIGASWIQDAGDYNITTNAVAAQTADIWNSARYASALDSANHTVIATVGRLNGVSARQASSTLTYYAGCMDAYDDPEGYVIRKFVNGIETTLATASNPVPSGVARITLTVNGTSLILKGRIYSGGWLDDQEVINITDSSIVSGNYAGITTLSNIGTTIDNWSAQDLVAAATALPRRALHGPFYGSLRGSVR